MKRLLILTGDVAAGKSTFAAILSRRYKTNVFYKDKIKEVLGDTIGFKDREENLKLSDAAVQLMICTFEEFAKLEKPLILEANFHKRELQLLQDIVKKYDYEVMTLMLQADLHILHERYMHRMKYENRHSVHMSARQDRFEDFKAYVEKARAEGIVGTVVTVCADDFSYRTDEELLGRIDQFMVNTK